MKPASPPGTLLGAAIRNKLIPTRALMALESFRQLILDAQAMMDPDFAGKLSADVAERKLTRPTLTSASARQSRRQNRSRRPPKS